MLKKILPLFFLSLSPSFFSQQKTQDTIYLMNGHIIGEKIIDTLLGAITILDPKKPWKKLHYELEQLYMVRFANGNQRYYYKQDSSIYNYFSRDEMWMFMKGERDSRRGFKARGSFIGAGIAGIIGGMTGTLWGPIAPYGYMACVGIPRVKVKGKTVSNPSYIESDAYVLGYERVARHKRRISAVIGGSIGLAIGYSLYGLLHNYYPEDVGLLKH